MGRSRSADQLAAKMLKMSVALERVPKTGVLASAMKVKSTMLAGAAAAGLKQGAPVGRDRKNPARFGVNFDLKGSRNPIAVVKYRPTRIAAIFDSGAAAHPIKRRRSDANLGFGFGKLAFAGTEDVAYGPVFHPGVAGKRFWPATKTAAIRGGGVPIQKGVEAALLSVFK